MKKTLLLAFVSMFAMQAHASTDELINSVKSNNIPKVLELFSNGEDPNGINEQGNTALHYAVAMDNADMTQILLSYGADISVANLKGWTPLKIAEKKDLKNVTPVLVQYLQLQKNKQELAEFSDNIENNIENAPAEAVAIMQEKIVEVMPQAVTEAVNEPVAPENVPAEAVAVVQEQVVEEVPQAVTEAAGEMVAPENTPVENVQEQSQEEQEAQKAEFQKIIDQFSQAAIEAKNAQDLAEAQNKELSDELSKLRAEKAELEKQLAQKETESKAKAASKPVKPILNKKPAYKAPAPVAKKVVIKPSSMVDGIYAGDEEIVYCLDYLGNGENDNMKRAAGYYAASVSISEARYKQIVDKANDFYTKAEADNMTKRDNECSKIITPSDKSKQNIIVRSMNKSVGY